MADHESTAGIPIASAIALILCAVLVYGSEFETAKKTADEKVAQRTEQTLQERAAAEEIRNQPYDTLGLRFLPEDNIQQCMLDDTFTFLLPAGWTKETMFGTDTITYKANNYNGLFEVGIVRDLCLYCTSDDEVVDTICEQLDSLTIDRDKGESGTVNNARWHRFPANVEESSKANNYPYGFLEVVLSGHDAYYICTLCYARDYTSQIHEEMLRILNSVAGDFEDPLLLSKKATKPAEEGTMLNFLQELGEFAPFAVHGTGAQTLDLPRGEDLSLMPSQCLLAITYQGTGPFNVYAHSIADEYEDRPLVQTDGPYSGTVTNMYSGDGFLSYRQLAIEAEGDWEITVSPIANAPHAAKGATYTGDMVMYLDEESLSSISFIHSGDGSFKVYAAGMEGSKRIVDTTGDVSDSVEWNDPHTLLVINSDGEWAIDWK